MSDARESQGKDVAAAEIDRQRRVLDMMISMQSSLRDFDRTVGTGLVCSVLVLSLIGTAFAFAGGGVEAHILGIGAQRSTWLGWLAVLTGALTLVELVLDLRGAARRRDAAVERLSELNLEFRQAPGEDLVLESRERSTRYAAVTGELPPIPNLLFPRLKAAHLRKVEISKILSDAPGISVREAKRRLEQRLQAGALQACNADPDG